MTDAFTELETKRRDALLAKVAEAKARLAELELETAANVAACAEAEGAELERLVVHHGRLQTEQMVLSGVVALLERQRLPELDVTLAQEHADGVKARGQELRQELADLRQRRAKVRDDLSALKVGQQVPGYSGNPWAAANDAAAEVATLQAREAVLLDELNASLAAAVEAQQRLGEALAARDRAGKGML
jgi:hypothetical protein